MLRFRGLRTVAFDEDLICSAGSVQTKGWLRSLPAVDEGADGGDPVLNGGEGAAAQIAGVLIPETTSTLFIHSPDVAQGSMSCHPEA